MRSDLNSGVGQGWVAPEWGGVGSFLNGGQGQTQTRGRGTGSELNWGERGGVRCKGGRGGVGLEPNHGEEVGESQTQVRGRGRAGPWA